MPLFLKGLVITLEIAAVAGVFALLWGLILLLLRISKIKLLYLPAMAYIDTVRNIPVLIQMYVIYFGLPSLGLTFSSFICGALALTIQNAGYLAEIYRGGVEAISKAQYESGLALGMRRFLILRKVILPQALKSVIPPIVNQLILLLKDTSLVSSIAVMEMTHVGKILTERSAATYEIFITLAVIYILINSLLSLALNFYERRVRVLR